MDKLDKLKSKFEAQGCSVEVQERTSETLTKENKTIKDKHKALIISVPKERGHKQIIISDQEDIDEIQISKIEKFRFINGYNAIWSKDLNVIECQLETDLSPYFYEYGINLGRMLDFSKYTLNPYYYDDGKQINFPPPKKGVKITLGYCSKQFWMLEKFQRKWYTKFDGNIFTLRIEGIIANSHGEALSMLIKLSNTVLFQFDLVTQLPVRLAVETNPAFNSTRVIKTHADNVEFSNPKFEYDKEPLSLYMYARAASEMPLLQYLAFYQVLEFYFPIYSLNEAQSKIKNYIKSPLFDVNKDSDIAHIVNLIKTSSRGKSIGDERTQIKATIQAIIDQETLRDYYNENSQRKDFFDQQKKNKGIAKQRINFSLENDIRVDTALRIYELRCRVVHSKDDENFELLLPYSQESAQMGFDLHLIEHMAQKAIIAGSRPLII